MLRGAILLAALLGASCASPAGVETGESFRMVTITPQEPTIGQPFTVKLASIPNHEMPVGTIPDGTYSISLYAMETPRSVWEQIFLPAPPTTRKQAKVAVSIGTLTVSGGAGEAQFVLMPSYDKGLSPVPGKPIGLSIDGATFNAGQGFLVGRD